MPKRRGTPARGPGARRRQRTASPGEDLDIEEPCNLTDAGELASRSNSIDFEQIIRASNILPQEKLTENLTGCGSQIEPTISQIRLGDESVAAHIPKAIKDQITRGEYINLALLLKGTIELNEICSGSELRLNSDGSIVTKPKQCKDKLNSIEKWTDAFIIFSAIFTAKFPCKNQELLHYMFNIRECAARQGGTTWITYDEQFRLRQAQSPQSWSLINNDLWWRCMLVQENNAQASQPTHTKHKYSCNDYNNNVCRWPNCRFSHSCSHCGASHPALSCPTKQGPNQMRPNTNTFRRQPFSRQSRGRGRGFIKY